MSDGARQMSLHEFSFRHNQPFRSRSPCTARHTLGLNHCETMSVHSSSDAGSVGLAEPSTLAQPALDAISGYHVFSAIGPYTYSLWQCMDYDTRNAYQAISFWARSDSRWHGRDLGMWDKASHRTRNEQAESEPATSDSVLSDSALPDSENETVYLTLPRKGG